MKAWSKKLISAVLLVSMLLSMLPLGAMAAEGEVAGETIETNEVEAAAPKTIQSTTVKDSTNTITLTHANVFLVDGDSIRVMMLVDGLAEGYRWRYDLNNAGNRYSIRLSNDQYYINSNLSSSEGAYSLGWNELPVRVFTYETDDSGNPVASYDFTLEYYVAEKTDYPLGVDAIEKKVFNKNALSMSVELTIPQGLLAESWTAPLTISILDEDGTVYAAVPSNRTTRVYTNNNNIKDTRYAAIYGDVNYYCYHTADYIFGHVYRGREMPVGLYNVCITDADGKQVVLLDDVIQIVDEPIIRIDYTNATVAGSTVAYVDLTMYAANEGTYSVQVLDADGTLLGTADYTSAMPTGYYNSENLYSLMRYQVTLNRAPEEYEELTIKVLDSRSAVVSTDIKHSYSDNMNILQWTLGSNHYANVVLETVGYATDKEYKAELLYEDVLLSTEYVLPDANGLFDIEFKDENGQVIALTEYAQYEVVLYDWDSYNGTWASYGNSVWFYNDKNEAQVAAVATMNLTEETQAVSGVESTVAEVSESSTVIKLDRISVSRRDGGIVFNVYVPQDTTDSIFQAGSSGFTAKLTSVAGVNAEIDLTVKGSTWNAYYFTLSGAFPETMATGLYYVALCYNGKVLTDESGTAHLEGKTISIHHNANGSSSWSRNDYGYFVIAGSSYGNIPAGTEITAEFYPFGAFIPKEAFSFTFALDEYGYYGLDAEALSTLKPYQRYVVAYWMGDKLVGFDQDYALVVDSESFQSNEMTYHTVTVGSVENGTLTVKIPYANADGKAPLYTEAYVYAEPAEGYRLKPGSIKVNGTIITSRGFMVTEDAVVTAEFEQLAAKSYNVVGGSIDDAIYVGVYDEYKSLTAGSEGQFYLSVDSSKYSIDRAYIQWTDADGKIQTADATRMDSYNQTYTFTMPEGHVTILVDYTELGSAYTVTLQSVTGGSLNRCDRSGNHYYGSSTTYAGEVLYVEMNSGSHYSTTSVDYTISDYNGLTTTGVLTQVAGPIYSLTVPETGASGTLTITATVEEHDSGYYWVNSSYPDGGYVSSNKSTCVAGEPLLLSVSTYNAYVLDRVYYTWTDDTGITSDEIVVTPDAYGVYWITMPEGAVNLGVEFSPIQAPGGRVTTKEELVAALGGDDFAYIEGDNVYQSVAVAKLENTITYAGTETVYLTLDNDIEGPDNGPVFVVESGKLVLTANSISATPGSDAIHVEGGTLVLQGSAYVYGGELTTLENGGNSCGSAVVVRNNGNLKVNDATLYGGNIAAALKVDTTGTIELGVCVLTRGTSNGIAADLDRNIGSCIAEGQVLMVYKKYEYQWYQADDDQLNSKYFDTNLKIYPKFDIAVDEIDHVTVTAPETGVYDTEVLVCVEVENGYAWENPNYTLGYQQDGYYGMSSLNRDSGKNYYFYMPYGPVTLELYSKANIVELEEATLLTESVFSAGQEIWSVELADPSLEWDYLRFAWLQDGKTVFEQEIHTADAALGLINPGLAAGEYILCLYYGQSNYYDNEYGLGKQTIQVTDLPTVVSAPADPESLAAGTTEFDALAMLECPLTHIPDELTLLLQQVTYSDDGSAEYTTVATASTYRILWEEGLDETQSLLEFTVTCDALTEGEYRLLPCSGTTALPLEAELIFTVPFEGGDDSAVESDKPFNIYVRNGLYGYRNDCYDCVFPYDNVSVMSCEIPGASGSGSYEIYDGGYLCLSGDIDDLASFDVDLANLYSGEHTLYVYDASYTELGQLNFWRTSNSMLCREESWLTPDGGFAPIFGDEMTLIPLNIDLNELDEFYPTVTTSLGEKELPYTLNKDGSVTLDLSDVPYGMVKFFVKGRIIYAENSWSNVTLVEETILYRLPGRADALEAPVVGESNVDDNDVVTMKITHRETPDADVTMHIYRVADGYVTFNQTVELGKEDYLLSTAELELDEGDYLFAFTMGEQWMSGASFITVKVPGKYNIAASPKSDGLTISVPTTAREGETVYFTAAMEDPLSDYVSAVWAEWYADIDYEDALAVRSLGGGRYSFVMPSGDVTIYANSAKITEVDSLLSEDTLLLNRAEWWLNLANQSTWYEYLRGKLYKENEDGSLSLCLEQESRDGSGLMLYPVSGLTEGTYRLYVYGGTAVSGAADSTETSLVESCLGWQRFTLVDGYWANATLLGRNSLSTGTTSFKVAVSIDALWYDTLPEDLTVQVWQVGEEVDTLVTSSAEYGLRYFGSKTSGSTANNGKGVDLVFYVDLGEKKLTEGYYYVTIGSNSVKLVDEDPYEFKVSGGVCMPEVNQKLYYVSETGAWGLGFQTENVAAGTYKSTWSTDGNGYTLVVDKTGWATVDMGSSPLNNGTLEFNLNGTSGTVYYYMETVTSTTEHYNAAVDGLFWVNGTCNGVYMQGAMFHSYDGVSTTVTLPGASGSGYYTVMYNGMNQMTRFVSDLSSFEVELSGMDPWVPCSLQVYNDNDAQVAYIDITFVDMPVLGVKQNFWGRVDSDILTLYPAGLTEEEWDTLRFFCSDSRGETELSWAAGDNGAVLLDFSSVPVGNYDLRAVYENCLGAVVALQRGNWTLQRVPNAQKPTLSVAKLQTTMEEDFSVTAPVVYENGIPTSDVTMRIYAMDDNQILTWIKDVKIGTDSYVISSKELGLDGRYAFFFYEGEKLIGTADGNFREPGEYNMLQDGVMLTGEGFVWHSINYPLPLRDLGTGSGYIRSVLMNENGELVSQQEYHAENLNYFELYNTGVPAGSYKLYLVVNNSSGEQVIGWQKFQIIDASAVYTTPADRWDLTTDTREWDVSVIISGCKYPEQIPNDLTLSLVQIKDANGNTVDKTVATLHDYELYYGGKVGGVDVAETTGNKKGGLQMQFHFDLNSVVLREGNYALRVSGEGLYQRYGDEYYVTDAPWIESAVYNVETDSVTTKCENLPAGSYDIYYSTQYAYQFQYGGAVVDQNGNLTVYFGSDPYPNCNTSFQVTVYTDSGECYLWVNHTISAAEGDAVWYDYELDQTYNMGGMTVNGVWVNQVYPYTELGQTIEVTLSGLEGVPGKVQWSIENLTSFQDVKDLSSFTIDPGATDLRNTMVNVWISRTDTEDGEGIMVLSFSFFCSDWAMVAYGEQNYYGDKLDGPMILYPLNLENCTGLKVGYTTSDGPVGLSYEWRKDGSIAVDCSELPYGKYELWAEATYSDKTGGTWTESIPVCRAILVNWYAEESDHAEVNPLSVVQTDDGDLQAAVTYEGEPAGTVTMYVYRSKDGILEYSSQVNIGSGAYTISADALNLSGTYVFFFAQEDGVCLGSQAADFSDKSSFTVTFKDWNGAVLSIQTVEANAAAEAPEVPGRSGYTFTGWSADFDCVTANLTVTARYIWNNVRVTFYAAPGILNETTSKIVLLEKNADGTAAVSLPDETPSRSGYTFTGWYTDRDCTTPFEDGTDVNRDTVLYAGWLATPYTIHTVNDENDNRVLYPEVNEAVFGETVKVIWAAKADKVLKSVLLTYTRDGINYSYHLTPDSPSTVSFTMPAAEVTLSAVVIEKGCSLTVTWGKGVTYVSIRGINSGEQRIAYPSYEETSVTFEYLPADEYQLYFSTGWEYGWYSSSQIVTVGSAGTNATEITLPKICSISGTIKVENDGKLPNNLYIYAQGSDGYWYYGSVSSDGTFGIRGLPGDSEITYTINVYDTNCQYRLKNNVVTVNGEDVTDLEMILIRDEDLLVTLHDNSDTDSQAHFAHLTVQENISDDPENPVWVDIAWQSGSGKDGTVYYFENLIQKEKQENASYRVQFEYAQNINYSFIKTVSEPTGEFTYDEVYKRYTADLYFAASSSDITCVAVLDKADAYPGDTVNLTIRYFDSRGRLLDPNNMGDYEVELPEGLTLVKQTTGDKSISMAIKLSDNAEGQLEVLVTDAADGVAARTTVNVAEVVLTAPDEVENQSVFKMVGEGPDGKTIVLRNADTNAVLYSTTVSGRYFTFEVSADSEHFNVDADGVPTETNFVAEVVETGQRSNTENVKVLDYPVLVDKVWYSDYSWSKAYYNERLEDYSFYQYVDMQLYGYDLDVAVAFENDDQIYSVTYEFCGEEYEAERTYIKNEWDREPFVDENGVRITAWKAHLPYRTWGGSGLKNLTARIVKTDGTEMKLVAAVVCLLVDPSGVITDSDGNPLSGVTVTCQVWDEVHGIWVDWDAEAYGQINPQVTGEDGKYGWMVPEGTYRVLASKEGYVNYDSLNDPNFVDLDTGESTIVIPPARDDIDFTMETDDTVYLVYPPESAEFATVTASTESATAGTTVTLTVADVVEGVTLTGITVTTLDGVTVPVTKVESLARTGGVQYQFTMPTANVTYAVQTATALAVRVSDVAVSGSSVTINLVNLDENATVFAAAYNDQGQMLGVSSANVAATQTCNGAATVDVELSAAPEASSVKIFLMGRDGIYDALAPVFTWTEAST